MQKNLLVGALYIRVSSHGQDELSPDAQKRLGLDYAKNNGIIIPKDFIFIETVSGRNARNRREFQKMISLAKSQDHPIDVILVWKFSRFARNQEESIVYKSMLKKDKVDVISISEPLIDGPFGSLIERIIEWMDEYYSIRLSGEVLRGMKEKALREGYQLSPPLGYQAVGSGQPFVINEEEFKIVTYICEQYDTYGKDFTAIARQLNNIGYKTRRGNPFESRSVKRILQNPFYYGLVSWNGIHFIGTHEVRFTQEQFDTRMKKLQSRYRPSKRRDVSTCKHWLSGLLKCGYCGATMTYNGTNHSPGFQCYKYSKGLHNESCSISEKKILAAIYEYFESLLDGMDFEYSYRIPETPETNAKREELQNELSRISVRERRIALAFENGIDTLEEYAENKKRLKKEREELQKELEELDAIPERTNLPSKDEALSKVQTVYDVIKNPDVDSEIKGNVIRDLIECITYDKKNNDLIFHLYMS
ncbi:MAG: recombinase family protein [Schaedlerella sp.]|nr:recombinase family protein [Schaedlerella sp.]